MGWWGGGEGGFKINLKSVESLLLELLQQNPTGKKKVELLMTKR